MIKIDRFFIILIAIFLATFLVYKFTSPGETPYNYFTRLSDSFLHKRLYLIDNPPWLNELVPIGSKYFVVYPPMPAILMVPIVALLGLSAPQTLFSIFLGAVDACLVFILLKRMNFTERTSLLVTVFFAFGTDIWYLASVGSAWYISHVVALFLLLLALIEVFGKKRLLLIGFLIGASFWSRTTVIFTLPFFYLILWRKFWPISRGNLLNFLMLNLGAAFFVVLDALYNIARFGDISPLAAYLLIPDINKDPIFGQGYMSYKFIPRHLQAIFKALPDRKDQFPYIYPSLYSLAIWFTSPALIFILKAGRSLLTLACVLAIIPTFLVISFWAGVGYSQFGYRFAQDFMPFLLILLALGIGKKPNWFAYLLVSLSILVNLWGVILINKFGIFTI